MVSAPTSKHGVRFGVFEVDFEAGELRKHGVRINLQEQPFRLLAALLEQPGQLVTRDKLRQQIWPADTFVDLDCSLNTAVLKVRQALGDSATHSRFLETVPKRGYRFVAPIEALTLGSSPSASMPMGAAVRARGMHRLRWPVAAAVICLIVLVFAGKWWSTRGRGGKAIRTVVVLPLQNLSGDSSQDYFAGGMTEELITALAKIDAISVIKGTGKRVDQIVHEFHVDAIVEGSLVRSGEQYGFQRS